MKCCWMMMGLLLAFSATPASRSADEILAALEQVPVNRQTIDEARRLMELPVPGDASERDLIHHYWRRARAAGDVGLIGEQIKAMREVVSRGGGEFPVRALKELAVAEFNAGNLRDALAARQKAIAMMPPQMRGQLLGHVTAISEIHRRLGDLSEAHRHAERAESILLRLRGSPRWSEFQHNWQASVEENAGRLLFSQGRYTEAEARFRRALEFRDKDLERQGGSESDDMLPFGQQENVRDGLESWLATALLKQNRLAEAEAHARNVLLRAIRRGGLDSMQTCKMLQNLAMVLNEANRHAEGLVMVDHAAKILETLEIPAGSYFVARNHRLRAGMLVGLQRWPEALREFDLIARKLSDDPQLAEVLGAPNPGWIRSLLALGRHEEALKRAEIMVRDYLQRMGPDAYETAEAQGYRGVALAALGRDEESLAALRESLGFLIPAVSEQQERTGRRFARLGFIVDHYLALLSRIRGTAIERRSRINAVDEAFRVADAVRGRAVQHAMAASAARAASGSPELAELVRWGQDLRQERDALFVLLADLMSRPQSQLTPQITIELRKRAGELERQQRSVGAEISARFPDYADLMTPKPAGIADIQAVLKPGEAMISILSNDQQAFVWAIPASGPAFFSAVPMGRKEIAQLVERVRAAVDPGSSLELGNLPVFDGAAAYRLYAQLLEPVRAGWDGAQHLMVTTGGRLSRLPFALLLTSPPPSIADKQKQGGYGDWPWLIRKSAISQLPAASSLLTLRRMPPGAQDRLPFAGFGDPDFGGAAGAGGRSRGLRSLPVGIANARQAQLDYSQIAPLPETRDEILALAEVMHADQRRDVYLGAQASRERVMQSDLVKRRVIAFATHGLLPGEFPGVDQPALALSNPGGGKHGLLTLDDILGLKLDADWVVLSACNSAAGGEQGGEALSGLGRGFFFAGSRALLVTHWPVETHSAKKLVVGVFAGLSKAPEMGRAEALRRSILRLMQEKDGDMSYDHPLFWAPYALVGDGGR